MLKITAVSIVVKLILTAACIWKARKEGRKSWVWGSLGALTGLWALLALFAVSGIKRRADKLSAAAQALSNTAAEELPSSHWFYANSEYQATGPVSLEHLKNIIQTGEVTQNQLVWHPSITDWKQAKEVLKLGQ